MTIEAVIGRRVLWLVAAVAVLACSGAVAAASSGVPVSSSELVRLAMRDATARGSFHESSSGHAGAVTITFSDDVAAGEGRQLIRVSRGWETRVLVIGRTAYISGNQAGLMHFYGFPSAVARKVGSDWVAIAPSNRAYGTVTNAVTLASALADITPSGQLTETAPATIDGTPAIGIRGTVPASRTNGPASAVTLYVSRSATPLPLKAVLSDGNGDNQTATLSDWGEHIALAVPRRVFQIAARDR